jgi:peptidoglycan/xylan/chitin deacetylase (PgdA/CDA1 family)
VTVDGVPATPSTRLRADDTLQVVQPGDVVEDVVEADEVIPAPPLPPTINVLWHPGVPGKVVHRKGAVSGEIVGQDGQTVPPVPPRPVTEKLVALTFDDGPWPTTPVLLDELKAAQVPAMFCLIGRQLVTARLAAAQRALAEGHHVCNHTIDHDEHLATEPLDKVQLEVDQGDVFIRDRLKVQPTFFRPPGGSNGPMVEQVAAAHGEHVLMRTVDTQDYKTPGVAAIVARAVGGARPGAIILLHDGGGDRAQTYAAVPQIIQQLKALGYTFVMPDQVPG